ncbi:MAG TPA: hypothetical protein ENJ40_01045 [Thermosulfurimonas dismutans]|uniref:PD-(D/E)XK endonuclease-like domain-containing protein n=1 Tax=Thermosulfurimonas dismutans TaxID=999894 RepID=A0A7C3CJ59_9BACT|nr:hypothetical protein [Thermosulfurimonas dismutans]
MRLRIYQQKRALALLGERDEERQLGEMAHLALYFLEDYDGTPGRIEEAVSRALALYTEPLPEREKFRKRLLEVLTRALSHPEIARFFAPGIPDLREHPFVRHKGRGGEPEVHRPDRVLLLPEGPVVLEYKLHRPEDPGEHERQVREYLSGLSLVLKQPVRGCLVYLEPPEVREVRP